MADKIANVALSNNHPLNILIGNWIPWRDLYTDISCLGGGGYLRKIQVEYEKLPEPKGEGNLVSRLVFFENTPPKHDISV